MHVLADLARAAEADVYRTLNPGPPRERPRLWGGDFRGPEVLGGFCVFANGRECE